MAAVSIYSDFGGQENEVCPVSIFAPSICHKVVGSDTMVLAFWILSFKPAFHSLLSLQSSPLPNFRTFSTPQKETLYLLPVTLPNPQPSSSHPTPRNHCFLYSQFWLFYINGYYTIWSFMTGSFHFAFFEIHLCCSMY